MKWTTRHLVNATPDVDPKGLDTRSAEHMSARQDVLRNVADAAETGGVADQLGRAAESGIEGLDLTSVQTGNQVSLGPVGSVLIQAPVELLEMAGNLLHPLIEEGLGRKLGHVRTLGEYLSGARLVALFVRVLHVAAHVPVELKVATEPLTTELVESFLDGGEEGVPEQGCISA